MADDADHIVEKVDAFVHDLLAVDEREQVERHCHDCPACGAALAEAGRRLRELRSLPPVMASEELIRRTERRIGGPVWGRRLPYLTLRRAVAAALVVLALTAVAHWYLASMSTPCYRLHVLGQARLQPGAETSLRVIVTEQSLDVPLSWVPVEISLTSKQSGESVSLTRFDTDLYGSGCPRFHLPDWADGDYELSVSARPRGMTAEVRRTVQLRRSSDVVLSTDRPVYQPGQTVQFRGLALRQSDRRPAGGEKAVFSVIDPNGNKIFQEERPTSRFGISSAELPLAEEITEGTYRLECQVGESTGSTSVEVKKYALPKFKVGVTTDRDYYEPGSLVHAKVRADYFFGKPVAAATVAVDVRSSDSADKGASRLTSQTDASGVAELQFPAPQARAGSPDERAAEVTLDVRVTDAAGQEQTVTVSRPVSARPFRIEALPEGGKLVPRWTNTVYLLTRYPDGRPARTELEIAGFPGKLRTDQFGVAALSFRPPEVPEYTLKVRATDVDGRTSEREVKLGMDYQGEGYLFRTDKAVYDAGETMHVTVRGEQGVVFFELLKDGQILLASSVGVSRGRGESAVDLPPDLEGPVVLSSYYCGNNGPSSSKTRLVYVRRNRQLDVRAVADRKEYRPGELARISLRVSDLTGHPAPGALSLSAVDEAVFSVAGLAPEESSALSAWERSRLQRVRSLYPSWSPDAPLPGTADERIRLEQALFSAAAGRGGESEQDTMRQQLLPFLEDSDAPLRVLDRPDWQELAPGIHLPPELVAGLRKDARFSLRGSVYSDNYQKVELQREWGLTIVRWLWAGYAVAAAIGVFAWVVYVASRVIGPAEFVIVIVIIGLLVGLLLPSVQAVRMAAPRTQSTNELKQIELAVVNYQAAYGKMPGVPAETADGPRVRQWFPETLLWRPEVVTDDNGRAEVTLPLADSITDWRLSASAVTADGRLGATRAGVRVFQPFFVDVNLPAALTRGDEIAFPVVVYNYLEKPQTVSLTLHDAAWFERAGETAKRVEIAAGEVRSLSFRIRTLRVGLQEVRVDATGEGVSDSIRKKVEVLPDGERSERVFNGDLRGPAAIDLNVPDDAVEGSVQALLRIYPSGFSQLVEGLDGIFRLPYGCFEQTSSVTYPNVLALDYLRRTGRSAPEVEAKAKKYIQLGYQRLLTFEVSGGGFDWFGRKPANQTLTAYGLSEFEDMSRVQAVDPDLIARTRKWLMDQRQADGSWQPETHQFAGGPAGDDAEAARLCTTAYIAAAVFAGGNEAERCRQTHDYLMHHAPASIHDPYTLALVCQALQAIDPQGVAAAPYLTRLQGMKRSSDDGQFTWWERAAGGRTVFYGAGRCGDVETTALACLALLKAGQAPVEVRGGLSWLTRLRDARGTWYSTQATVLALKALLAGTRGAGDKARARRVEVALDGKAVQEVSLPADQADVMKEVNLSPLVTGGKRRLRLTDRNNTAVNYQVTLRYHTPSHADKGREALALDLTYDRLNLRVGEAVALRVSVSNRRAEPAPMVMVELAVPPGFSPEEGDLAKLVEAGTLARFQQTGRSVQLYLRSLEPARAVAFSCRLRAAMPGTVTVAPAVAYEYYDPDRVTRTDAARLTVSPAE